MAETNGWLKLMLEKMQEDMSEMKEDIRLLREERAKQHGVAVVIAVIATCVINLLAVWLRA